MRWYIKKIWQSTNTDILVALYSREWEDSRKRFLQISLHRESWGLKLFVDKPQFNPKKGAITEILRKHQQGAVITAIGSKDHDSSLWITLQSAQNQWYWSLQKKPNYEFNLISPQHCSLLRFGSKGTFTRQKSIDNLQVEPLTDYSSTLLKATNNELSIEHDNIAHDLKTPISEYQRFGKKKVARRYKTVTKAHIKLTNKLLSQKDVDQLTQKAYLLQKYAYLITPNATQLFLDDKHTQSKPITITLDPTKTIGSNINEAFIAAKKSQKSLVSYNQQLTKINDHLLRLKSALSQLKTTAFSTDEVTNLLNSLDIQASFPTSKTTKHHAATHQHYRIFYGPQQETYLVGKKAQDNDKLTKEAKANDWWFHVSQAQGSHVIVPQSNLPRCNLSPEAQKEAAILALHYSPLKNNFNGEVYTTKRCHLKKTKDLAPGKWIVTTAKTLFVQYSPQELELIFTRKKLANKNYTKT